MQFLLPLEYYVQLIDPWYSERIHYKSSGKIWSCLLDVRIKPNNYTKHTSQVVIQADVTHSSPTNPKDDIIYRVTSEENITVVAITFLLYNHLEYGTGFHKGVPWDEKLRINYEDKLVL